MTIPGLSGYISTSQTSGSEQSIINQQAETRSFAQLFQDIQSGDLSAAQQDLSTYEQYAPNQSPSESDSSGTLVASLDKDLNSQNISGTQSNLEDCLSSANQVNVNSFMAGSKGNSIVSTSDNDQTASETVKVAGGTEMTFGTFTLAPSMVAAFQAKMDDRNGDSAAAQNAERALQAYMHNPPPGTGTSVVASV